jgi:prepilin-type processing-associated H-X9-DG protein
MMFDQAFNPETESYVVTTQLSTTDITRNGMIPGNRWDRYTQRHNLGGNIAFLDGHSAPYKWQYVYNQNVTPSNNRAEALNPDIWWNPNRDINP